MNHDKEFYEEIMRQSCSLQGFYGRFFYNTYLPASKEAQDEFISAMDAAGIESLFDYVMFMEA